MDLSYITSIVSLLSLCAIAAIYVLGAGGTPFGAVSLLSMTAITTLIYFYLMPVVALSDGDAGYFGMYITNLEWTHLCVLLYVLGAALACFANFSTLAKNPADPLPTDRPLNWYAFYGICGICFAGILFQVVSGKLNLTGSAEYEFAADKVGEFAFVTQAYNLLLPLTLVFLVRNKFGPYSILLLMIVLLIFLQIGFRYRIMILLAAVATAWSLTHRIKIRIPHALAGAAVALVIVNIIGAMRQYGRGLNVDNLTEEKVGGLYGGFGGEFGVVYVLNYIADNPLPPMAMFEPWLVGISRLVPSFIWADKPAADYVRHFISGASVANADRAGVAGSQQAEMILQFGWYGILPLAFMYFCVAAALVTALRRLPIEARVAGTALVPAFFGFYMQTRGYFFQIFADSLFMFGPLFFLRSGVGNKITSAVDKARSQRQR